MAEILELLAAPEDAAPERSVTLAGFLERAVHQRAKMARNLAQADEFIHRLGGRS
jgi:hypothetical protein